MATIRKRGGKFVEVAASGGQSYIEALQAAAEVIKLRSDNAV